MGNQATNTYQPDYAVTPGEVLEYELELRRMSKAELAKRTGLTEKHINSIVKSKGKSAITPETAIKLERALGMPVEYWLNLEANYQETQARLAEEAQLERDLDWLKKVPVNQMAKLGWLAKLKDKKAQLVEVLRFFGIASVDQWGDMWPRLAVAYRQHDKHEIYPEAVSAWLRQGELEAARIDCAVYDKANFRRALDEVRQLTAAADPDEFVPAMQEACAVAGVAVVFVPALPKTGVSGATQWLNPDKAVIQLSLRYKSNDHLWFTFFHEAGHILLHGKKELFIEGSNGMDQEKEQEANQFAEQELIPRKAFAEFASQTPCSKAAIIAFAESINLAPGVVVGQMQHKGLLPNTHCNDLKVRYEWRAA
ncbi:MAG: HigA family addiction module antitoxin [Candidatus Thiodiazotropha sp. 'RUGA']|nr:HigA family addiction module antitoxin [Candidatus Thiodiazotropha sp. 'RUGA']